MSFKLFYQSTETPHRHRCLKCGAVRFQNLKHGYNNLINHLNSCKPCWKNELNSVSDQQPLIFVSERARNVFGWIEWDVLEGREFSFVEKELTRKYSNLKGISRKTLVSYIQRTTKKVEERIAGDLPKKFGLIIDGWSDMGSSTYFLARTLFDGILSDFEDKNLTHYLGNDGICVYSSFENAIIAVIECKTLSPENEKELEVFKKPIELPIEQNDDKSYAESLLDQKRRKPMSHYGDLKWIPPTSNLAERLFSRVKYVFNDHRKSLLPVNLQSQIFLCVNRSFWDAKTIEDLM